MKKFSKRFSFVLAMIMLIAMSTVVLTSSAADNARIFWDFTGTTEDIAAWEGEARLWAYEPWSTADLEIQNNQMVIGHMHQDTGCNSLDLDINTDVENLSAYKSVALWIDTTAIDRAFTIKISIIDASKNFISITQDAPYALYPDNGQKQDLTASSEDGNWVFLTLPEKFKGYIEMPFASMKVLNWNANNKKDIDAELLSNPFRLLLEFNGATDGEVTKIDSVQLIKSGDPLGWVKGSGTTSQPSSSKPPVTSSKPPVTSSQAPASSEDPQSNVSGDVSDVASDESDIGTGSSEAPSDESEDESSSTTSATSSSKPKDDNGNTGLIVALIIVGVAVVAGGGFAAYKFIFSKK